MLFNAFILLSSNVSITFDKSITALFLELAFDEYAYGSKAICVTPLLVTL